MNALGEAVAPVIRSSHVVALVISLLASWAIGMALGPLLLRWLHALSFWKKKVRTVASDGGDAPVSAAQVAVNETTTPRAGGILVWASVIGLAALFWLCAQFAPQSLWAKLNFVTRSETWLPLFTMFAAGCVGLVDDWLVTRDRGGYVAGGIKALHRVALVALIGLVGACWFYFKLDWTSIGIPFYGAVDLGWLFIPLFVAVMLATFSSGVIDGVDGLSGGVYVTIFMAYGTLAIFHGQYQLAGFCAATVGALVAYLWFNAPPARFFMGETGILALSTTLTVIAFLTDGVFLLPLIGIMLVVESGSVILQLASKRLRHGKKIFIAAPIHHHLQAKGWSGPQITIRFWLLSVLGGLAGVSLYLVSSILK